MKQKNKRSWWKTLIKVFLTALLCLLLLLAAYLAYSALSKKKALSLLPADYSLYLHTDSVWEALEPMLDLRAADILLSAKDFVQFREPFMNLRASPLRSSKAVRFLASREVDAALYTKADGSQNFLAIVNMGILSAATRIAPLILPHLHIKELSSLSYVQGAISYFEWRDKDSVFYIKPYRNLVLVTQNKELLSRALEGNHDTRYTKKQAELIRKKNASPFKIVLDAKTLLESVAAENPALEKVRDLLSSDTLGILSFGISDAEANLSATIPLSEEQNIPALELLLSRESSMPSLLSSTSSLVQYYTILNAGSIEELKNAALPFIPPEKKADELLATASKMCKTLFSLTLEDILFSWTGKEIAALGIDGQNDPVFAVEITNEAQREAVFKKLTSSILIKNDNSLILDGVRLPRLALPGFLQAILSLFNVTLPSPYYMVFNNYIYFSESPEALSTIFTSVNAGKRIAYNEYWRSVSKEQDSASTLSLFYSLEKTMPFFLRGKGVLSQVLKLYSTGRFDVRIKDGALILELDAISRKAGDSRAIPGYGLALEGSPAPELLSEKTGTRKSLFWLENGSSLKTFNTASMELSSLDFPKETCYIAAAENSALKSQGAIWLFTKNGFAHLFDSKLSAEQGFPVNIGASLSAPVSVQGNNAVAVCNDGTLRFVNENGTVKTISLPLTGTVRSAPAVLGNTVALYDKSFAGNIFVVQNGALINAQNPVLVQGIAFGSPALLNTGGALYMAFSTQSGLAKIFSIKDKTITKEVELQLEGVFHSNFSASGGYFYILSDDALLTRLSTDGSTLSVQIPRATAKEGLLTPCDPDLSGIHNIYVSIDGNTLYGFTQDLELISGFPLVGWGSPAFVDVNGDSAADCFALTIDHTLNAWNVR